MYVCMSVSVCIYARNVTECEELVGRAAITRALRERRKGRLAGGVL